MNRGGSVLLVAALDETAAERYGTILIEASAVDLDERERTWRDAGWSGFDGRGPTPLPAQRNAECLFRTSSLLTSALDEFTIIS